MASWTAYSKIDAVYWSVMASFGISVTTFVGQNYGAGKKDRVKKGINVCLAIAMTVSLMISFILYFGGTYLYRMFTTDAGVVSIGMEMLRFLVPSYFTYVFIEIYSGSLRGMGNTLIPMILTSVGICGFRIVWIFIMVPIWNEVRTVLYSYPLSWIITSIFFIIYFRYYTGKQNNLGELKANI
jgi:Na+-driven multidrug efflux pump